jgi:hypothetical protein
VVHRNYEIEGLLFGIRSNSEEVGDWLHDVLGEYELTDEEADPYYSILLADEKGVGKRFHVLYEESRALVKTHDLRELGQALLYELESLALRGRKDAVYLEMAVVERDGVTALVPSLYPAYLRSVGRRAERALTLPLAPFVAVDPASGALLPIRRRLHVARDALDWLAELDPSKPRELWEPPDHVDLVLVFQWTGGDEVAVPVSRAAALYQLASQTANLHALGGRALHGLARLVEGARCLQLEEARPRDLLDNIAAVLGQREPVPA